MGMDAYPVRDLQPEKIEVTCRLLGTGASAPTLEQPAAAAGISVGRTGAGVYTLTFTDDPGTYVGHTPGFECATPANVEDHKVVVHGYSSKVLTFTVYDGTPAADDLEATEYLILNLEFKRTSL